MIEPLIMGYLASTPKNEISIELIEAALKNLETSQISSKLIDLFYEKSLYYSAEYFVRNINCPQFTIKDKIKLINVLRQYENFFSTIFGNSKDIEVNSHDLAECITNLSIDPHFKFEKSEIEKKLIEFESEMLYSKALLCAELLGD